MSDLIREAIKLITEIRDERNELLAIVREFRAMFPAPAQLPKYQADTVRRADAALAKHKETH